MAALQNTHTRLQLTPKAQEEETLRVPWAFRQEGNFLSKLAQWITSLNTGNRGFWRHPRHLYPKAIKGSDGSENLNLLVSALYIRMRARLAYDSVKQKPLSGGKRDQCFRDWLWLKTPLRSIHCMYVRWPISRGYSHQKGCLLDKQLALCKGSKCSCKTMQNNL